ncbi:MAG TPA: thioredoxin family protein [Polyangia bacterium]|jgi:peroxiredoxin|nr:thioredoxin family protein [Polyangia bacterium]
MAVETPPPELGALCPDFRLPGVDGKSYARDDFAASPVLCVMFICNHCPYVKAVEDRIIRLARAFEPRGVRLCGICANDAESYPDDAFDKLKERWQAKEYGFPYLYDEAQDVARAFGAVCTPDIFVYARGNDGSRRLAYRGRIDDSWKDESKVTRHELADALEALVSGQAPLQQQRPSMGCSIKWRQQVA